MLCKLVVADPSQWARDAVDRFLGEVQTRARARGLSLTLGQSLSPDQPGKLVFGNQSLEWTCPVQLLPNPLGTPTHVSLVAYVAISDPSTARRDLYTRQNFELTWRPLEAELRASIIEASSQLPAWLRLEFPVGPAQPPP